MSPEGRRLPAGASRVVRAMARSTRSFPRTPRAGRLPRRRLLRRRLLRRRLLRRRRARRLLPSRRAMGCRRSLTAVKGLRDLGTRRFPRLGLTMRRILRSRRTRLRLRLGARTFPRLSRGVRKFLQRRRARKRPRDPRKKRLLQSLRTKRFRRLSLRMRRLRLNPRARRLLPSRRTERCRRSLTRRGLRDLGTKRRRLSRRTRKSPPNLRRWRLPRTPTAYRGVPRVGRRRRCRVGALRSRRGGYSRN